MERYKRPMSYSSIEGRQPVDGGGPSITRLQLLKGAAGFGAAVAAGGLLAACGGDDGGSATTGDTGSDITSISDLGEVGGTLVVLTYEGYDGGAAIEPWLKQNGVDLRFQAISSQQEATAKLMGAGADTVDVVELALLEGQSYVDLDIPFFLEADWFPNGSKVRPFFLDVFRQEDGTLSGMPFVWAATPSNYRPDKTDPISSWQDLLDPSLKNRITLIDDALANIATGALALGHEDPAQLTPDQLEEISDFLRQLVDQARTVSASYGDMTEQLASGEVYATFSGWSALEVFAAAEGAEVKSAYPTEKSVGVVDAHAIPKGAPNKGTAAAYINEFLSPEMQVYVARDLASGLVVTDAAELLAGEDVAGGFDYENLDQLLEEKLAFVSAAPLEAEEGFVDRQDWLDAWEQVKA